MNKINIVDDKFEDLIIENKIEYDLKTNTKFGINEINITIYEDSDLYIYYKSNDNTKISLNFYIKDNVKCSIYELKLGKDYKIQYNYYIDEKASVNIYKFHNTNYINEADIINLNGYSSLVNFKLSTISKMIEKYNILINHNNNSTKSFVDNKGINMKSGSLCFKVTSSAYKSVSDTKLVQNNYIVNLSSNDCEIKPILLIDNNEVEASHSAYIGDFKKEDIFYLMSRGIDKNTSYKLLTKSLLLGNIDFKEYEDEINKYWG